MLPNRTFIAAAIIAASFSPVWGKDVSAPKPTVTPVLETSTTIIGQPIVYPAGQAQVTAVIITLPPGGQTGWHLHPVPLFGYMLQGALTVDYGAKGTHTYKTGEGLMEAMNWSHNGMNKGTIPVRILAVYAGAKGIAPAQTVAR